MVQDRTGGRYDGQPWAPRGGEMDVPDDEAQALCSLGIAEPVEQPKPAVKKAAAKAAKDS